MIYLWLFHKYCGDCDEGLSRMIIAQSSMKVHEISKQGYLYIKDLCLCVEYADRYRHIYLLITISVLQVLSTLTLYPT
jgi:hypothetical protein